MWIAATNTTTEATTPTHPDLLERPSKSAQYSRTSIGLMRSGIRMENIKKYKIASIAGVAALGAILAAVFATTLTQSKNTDEQGITYIPKRILDLQTGDELPRAEAASTCGQDLATVKSKAPFPILTPTMLPQGYMLKSVDFVAPDRATLQYSDGNVCGENAKKLRDGVIELVAGPLSTISDAKTGQEYIDSLMKNWANANATTFDFGGKYAVGYPAGVGTSRTIDENNVVVHTYKYDYPASIWLVDDSTGTVYRLTGYVPLEDLAKIAQSLK